jgi:hypothetical protein
MFKPNTSSLLERLPLSRAVNDYSSAVQAKN